MIRILATLLLCATTLGVLGCASAPATVSDAHRFTSDPYQYEFDLHL